MTKFRVNRSHRCSGIRFSVGRTALDCVHEKRSQRGSRAELVLSRAIISSFQLIRSSKSVSFSYLDRSLACTFNDRYHFSTSPFRCSIAAEFVQCPINSVPSRFEGYRKCCTVYFRLKVPGKCAALREPLTRQRGETFAGVPRVLRFRQSNTINLRDLSDTKRRCLSSVRTAKVSSLEGSLAFLPFLPVCFTFAAFTYATRNFSITFSLPLSRSTPYRVYVLECGCSTLAPMLHRLHYA